MRGDYRTLVMLVFQVPALVFSYAVLQVMRPGYWPAFDEDLVSASFVVGVLAAAASAWRATRVDTTYFTAQSSPWRAAMHHFASPIMVAILSLSLCAGVLSTAPLGDNPGGSPSWSIIISTFVWVIFAAVMGTGVGITLRGRGLFAALLSALLAIGCIIVSRVHEFRNTLVPVVYSWGDGSTVSGQTEPRFWSMSVASAAIIGLLIVVASISRMRWWNATGAILGAVAALSAIAFIVTPAGPGLIWRATDEELVCTHESRGARICGWPEELISIRELDERWDDITAAAEKIGTPIPAGTTYSEGLAQMPGNHGQFALRRLWLASSETTNLIALSSYTAVTGQPIDPFNFGWDLSDIGIAVSRALFPDAPVTAWSSETKPIVDWVDRTGPTAIDQLREPIEQLKRGEDPVYPWQEEK